MIARHLEKIIEDQTSKFNISNQPYGHVAQRFESLRAYGLLPRGTVRNSQHLTSKQIVSGLLSIVSSKTSYAGHTSLILGSLKPVGGISASFCHKETFCEALEAVIENDDDLLNKLIKVSVSDSEIYTNSHCRAAIHYLINGQENVAYYVDGHAVSLMQSGAETTYNPSESISSVVNEIIFYPSFFRAIERRLQHELSMPPVEYPEEPDTDEEIEKQQRAEYLGISTHSRFLNAGVDCQVTWPKHETVVDFDGYALVLMPKTKAHTTSIHIDLHKNKLSSGEAKSVIQRFLSLLTWCDSQFAVLQEGSSGSPVPIPVPKRNLAFSTAYQWAFDRKKPNDPDVRKAIAIYREGRNAQQNFLVSYAVLSYFKIIEIRHKKKVRVWFKENYNSIREHVDAHVIKSFEKHCGQKKVENYLENLCRDAVAHAGDPHNVDPDNYDEISRLYIAAQVLQAFARHLISTEMSLSDSYFDGT